MEEALYHYDLDNLELMSDTQEVIACLQNGEVVVRRYVGDSMSGVIEKGQSVVFQPVTSDNLELYDVVVCKIDNPNRRSGSKVKGPGYFFHQIVGREGDTFIIGNNKGWENGITTLDKIFGVAIAILSD